MSNPKTKRPHVAPSYPDGALFHHKNWAIIKSDPRNMEVLHWEEHQMRKGGTPTGQYAWKWAGKGFYSTLGGAIKSLGKHIGFACADLKDCAEQLNSLNVTINRANI